MSIRVIVFDAVHTLIHPSPDAISVYEMMATKYLPELFIDSIPKRFRTAYAIEERYDEMVLHWRTDEDRERQRWHNIIQHTLPGLPEVARDELYQLFADPQNWVMLPEVGDMLHQLSQHYKIVVASNFDARLKNALMCDPVSSAVISDVFISAKLGYRKPSLMFFSLMQQKLQCKAGEIMMVGDDLKNDFEAASAAGMVSVLYDPTSKYPIKKPRITSLAELIELMPTFDADHP